MTSEYRRPEATENRGDDGEVNVVDMVWSLGCYSELGGRLCLVHSSWQVGLPLLQHPADGRGRDVKPRPRERFGDLDLAEGGAKGLKPSDEMEDEVWEAVHGLGETN